MHAKPMSTACQTRHLAGAMRTIGRRDFARLRLSGTAAPAVRWAAEVEWLGVWHSAISSHGHHQFAFSAVSTLISTRRFLAWLTGFDRAVPAQAVDVESIGIKIGILFQQSFLDGVGPVERQLLDQLDGHLAFHRAVGVAFDDDPRGCRTGRRAWRSLRARSRRSGRSAPRPICRRSSD